MAGSIQFINGMAPGISSMLKSLVDQSAAEKGYKYGVDIRKAEEEARKIANDIEMSRTENALKHAGIIQHVAGLHGVPQQYVQALMTGGDVGAYNVPRDVSNNVMRDLGAFMYGKPTDVSSYHGGMAELPMKQAKSSAAVDLLRMARENGNGGITDQMRVLSAIQSGGQLHQPNQTSAENRLLDMFLNPATRKDALLYRQSGATSNIFPGGFIEKVGEDGKPHKYMVSHEGKLYDLGMAVDNRDPLKVAISESLAGKPSPSQAIPVPQAPAFKASPSSMPQAKSQYTAPNGRVVSFAEIEATARKYRKTPQQVIDDLGLK